jgi:hypothetical protein
LLGGIGAELGASDHQQAPHFESTSIHRTLGKISAHQYYGDTQSFGDVSELYLPNIFLAKHSANTAPLDSSINTQSYV